MKKFSEFKLQRLNEQEVTLGASEEKKEEVKPAETATQTEQTQETAPTSDFTPVKFFSKLFESREMAHVYHLQVKGEEGSHAAHLALNSYYDEILGFIDEIIEIYQGQYGVVEGYESIDVSETTKKDKVQYFEELVAFIKENKKVFNQEDTHLYNIVDEIVSLMYKTLYKLKYNK